MSGEKDLAVLLQDMEPVLNPGEYVFCTIEKLSRVPGLVKILFFFRETEAVTIVPKKIQRRNGTLITLIFLPGLP
ncbi:MAG: hypothetical protein MUW56_18965 [Chryseobacterium sp.]|uniref:ACT domain-containing protein n=1 Tax=Chryseobacterium sp. TaxID=1871047 RepID=UPI0025C1D3E9|nr:ACT domain-containing protein [Chryseobacterium sp.]MCJ7935644.1 hypothetical protein [Chryseobacterium sp.]